MIAPELEAIRADFHHFIDSIEDALAKLYRLRLPILWKNLLFLSVFGPYLFRLLS